MDRKIYRRRLLFFPHCARHLFAVQKVMLDACEDAAPVATVDCLINYTTDFHINPVATQNPVVYAPEQIEKPALFALRRVTVRLVTVTPGFGFVLRHYSPHIILLSG